MAVSDSGFLLAALSVRAAGSDPVDDEDAAVGFSGGRPVGCN